MERTCVRERNWISREEFLDMLAVANLIPGPTSTELAMHIGRHRAGWPGLIAAGLAFIVPPALIVGALAAVYMQSRDLPILRGIVEAVQPVVLVVVFDAILPLARTAIRTGRTAVIAIGAVGFAAFGIPEIVVLLFSGLAHVVSRPGIAAVMMVVMTGAVVFAQSVVGEIPVGDVFLYFATVGSLLFGSGYVLVSVLEGDLVGDRGWLTSQQLLEAVAAGQATPGPVFTTATFIGYLLGGPVTALVATVGMFLPAFVFAAIGSISLDRLRRSTLAQAFLGGVNAAAVVLIAMVIVQLGRTALHGWMPVAIMAVAAALLFGARIASTWLLFGAAVLGALLLR
jgi:chromate transporter